MTTDLSTIKILKASDRVEMTLDQYKTLLGLIELNSQLANELGQTDGPDLEVDEVDEQRARREFYREMSRKIDDLVASRAQPLADDPNDPSSVFDMVVDCKMLVDAQL